MQNNILILDSPLNNILLKEVISFQVPPFDLTYCNSIPEALEIIKAEQISLLMIGDGIIMQSGFEIFIQSRAIPIVILCEEKGFNFLLEEELGCILSITRPFDLEGIPAMFEAAYQFLKLCKEKKHVFPKDRW